MKSFPSSDMVNKNHAKSVLKTVNSKHMGCDLYIFLPDTLEELKQDTRSYTHLDTTGPINNQHLAVHFIVLKWSL